MMGYSNLRLELIAKLWCWTLHQFGKCVFLSPNLLVRDDADALFKNLDFSAITKSGNPNRFSTNLYVFTPSLRTFEQLMEAAEKSGIRNVDDTLNEFFKDWNRISSKSVFQLDRGSERNLGHFSAPIIQVEAIPSVGKMDEESLNNSSKEWLKVYCQRVLPILDNQTIDPVRDFMTKFLTLNGLPGASPPEIQPEESLEDYMDTIAVVGMSCRFPGANSPEEYWKLLSEGREAIRTLPSDRPILVKSDVWNIEAGFLNCPVDMFDNKFFGISPREAVLMDPQQRLLLEVMWEGLEDAGINPQKLRNTDTGVYVGLWQQDYERIIMSNAKATAANAEASHFLHTFLGNKASATASRMSYCLGLNGPALAVESGCSSSLNGVHLACESLHTGETNLALVSGVNMILLPVNPFSGKQKTEDDSVVLSKDFKCKTFDESANGFVRAEGCGVVVLKRFEDARRDGDRILTIIRGTAVNNDGAGTSFGTPNEKAQEKVYRAAMKRAKVAAADVSFVEAHGTGTIVGDPIEMYAVAQAYSENRTEPLYVSSVKTNIGHCEAAAGIASLIKVILCIQNGAIPPHLNLKTLNPRINLERIPAIIPLRLTEWTASPKIAAISSFSMSATNAHVIVQEPPGLRTIMPQPAEPMQIVTISAKSEEALKALGEKYLDFLKVNTDTPLSDIAYAANIGRASLQHRMAIVANDTQQLLSRLEKKNFSMGKAATLKDKIGFLFTGQGSQYIGMAKGLQEVFPAFRAALEEVEVLFQSSLNESLQNVIWNDNGLLNQTLYCQPAIFCIQYCLLQLWSSFGVKPDYVLGHSIGEFAAAVCAEILSLEDAMKLVVARSQLVHALPTGSMLALRAPLKTVKELISAFTTSRQDAWIDIAAINSPEEVVVSGSEAFIKEFEVLSLNNNVKSVSIPATHAFHSRDMDSLMDEFRKTAETVTIGTPSCVYVSGTLAKVMESVEFDAQYFQRHLRDTVRFSEAVGLVWAECKTLIEVGAQPILLGLAMGNVESTTGVFCPSLRRKDDATTSFYSAMAKLYISGVDFDWNSMYGIRQKNVSLPHYPFQRQKYWYVDEDAEEDELTPIVHPLLGRQFLSPLSELVFCQTYRLRELSYLEDHQVAGYVVVPMAGLLECCMAAGREVLQGGSLNKFPITIENMTVEAALPLEKSCRMQTLIASEKTAEDCLKYRLTINRKMGAHYDKWKRHAQAVFAPSSKLPDLPAIDLEELKTKLTHKESLETFYEEIAKVGIQFGPKFRSLVTAWYSKEHFLGEVKLPEDAAEYICHPIILDATIQSFAFGEFAQQNQDGNEAKRNLYLPLSIKKFTWFSRTLTQQLFVHSDVKAGKVTLYNDSGEPLGVMEGLELIQTTTNTIVRAIRAETQEIPEFMCDRWRPSMGKTSARIDLTKMNSPSVTSPDYISAMDGVEKWKADFLIQGNATLMHFLMMGLTEAGWPWPGNGQTLDVEDWKKLMPTAVNPNVVGQYMRALAEHGYLAPLKPGRYEVLKQFPTTIESETFIADMKARPCDGLPFDPEVENNFGEWFGKCLPQILLGKMTPLEFLFPEDPTAHGALYYYTQAYTYNHQNVLIKAVLSEVVRNLAETSQKDGILRILEVGAGTGSSSVPCIAALNEMKIPFHYTFTDISPMFLNEAKTKLTLGANVIYQTLNIELDPLSQGFSPEEFDLVIGVQVVHATANLTESLTNIKKLLKVNGVILLGEGFRLHNMQTFTFGMLDGWWRFSDFRLNGTMTALASQEQWKTCLENIGFDGVVSDEGIMIGVVAARNASPLSSIARSSEASTLTSRKTWLVINDNSELQEAVTQSLEAYERNVHLVSLKPDESGGLYINPEDETEYCNLFSTMSNMEGVLYLLTEYPEETIVETQRRLSASLLNLLKGFDVQVSTIKVRPRFVVVTRGVYNIGDAGPGNPNGATAWGLMKVFRNEYHNLVVSLVDLDQSPSPLSLEASQVFTRLWSQDDEMFTAFRGDKLHVMRLTYVDKPKPPVCIPHSDRYKLINPESGAFSDIEIGPTPQRDISEEEVEIEIRATALNFRDLFMVLKPDGFELPKEGPWVNPDSVGLDVAGIVAKIGEKVTRFKLGDEVFGFTLDGGIGSHCVAPEKALMLIPSHMTFVEASTIPCAYVTAHVGLVEMAKITKDDTVLIHVASGGVGVASVHVVRAIGSEIFATAGSKRKRKYLRSLGIKYVYHSRDTSYKEGILRDTDGVGVTVVLNSLTQPNFKEATLDSCAQGARFIEIAKVNIWKPAEVEALRPDVKYTVLDLSDEEAVRKGEADGHSKIRENCSEIEKYVADGTYKGLPSVVFPLTQLRDAFYYFQKAKHIGKIVVRMPITTLTGPGKLIHNNCLFNVKSTYLITGGLGGIGVEVTKWMLSKGARTIVLAGRNPPKPIVQKIIDEYNGSGANIIVIQADVGEYEECARILDHINQMNLAPLRGIMHAAGVLADNLLAKQNPKDFEYVLRPKVYGSWYLHTLTLNYQLEFFIMFSSLSGLLGILGQYNHASANRFLDALTHMREAMGLPSTTINWGGWSDVGAAAHIAASAEVFSGMRAFTPSQGLAALDAIMNAQDIQVAVTETSDWNIVKDLFRQGKYLDEMKSHKLEETKFDKYEHLIEEIKQAATFEERQEKIETYITAILKQTLNLPQTEVLDVNQDFSEFGVDSLMAMEMRNRLHDVLGDKTLSISALQENRTIRSLSKHLAHVLETEGYETRPLAEILKEDVVLSEDIKAAEVPAIKPSEFKNVLITGTTGHLGIHCLAETLSSHQNLTLHCLIRAESDEVARERLEAALIKYQISIDSMDRVIVVAGDVTKEGLGLTPESYEALSQTIDAVIHCAAKTSHVENYSDGNKHDLRTNNVVGLINVLKFTCNTRTKPLLHASSLLSANKLSEDGLISEEFPDTEDMGEGIKHGYVLTKFVGEKLLAQAKERGIPVTTIRFPGLFGSSKTGYMPPGYNHIWSTILAAIRVRMVPQVPKDASGVPIMAVDSAAKLATSIFLNDDSELGVYNFTVESAVTEDLIRDGLNEHGVECEFVPFKEWREAVFEEAGGNLLGPVASLYAEEDGETRLYSLHSLSKEAGNIDVSYFSLKVKKNYPEVSSVVQDAGTVIRRHLKAHFDGLITPST